LAATLTALGVAVVGISGGMLLFACTVWTTCQARETVASLLTIPITFFIRPFVLAGAVAFSYAALYHSHRRGLPLGMLLGLCAGVAYCWPVLAHWPGVAHLPVYPLGFWSLAGGAAAAVYPKALK